MKIVTKKVRLPLNVDRELKDEFKAVTALREESMASVLVAFIKAYLGAHRDQLERLIEKYRDKGAS